MRIYNRYIITLSLLLLLTTVALSALGENRLDLYYSIYLIEGLAVTELYVYLNPRAKRGLRVVNYVLFAGFMILVAAKVVEILWGIKLW